MPLEVIMHYYFTLTVISSGLFEITLSEEYEGIKFPAFTEWGTIIQISFFSIVDIFYFNKGL